MGVGKSSVGRVLASSLARRFVDLDSLIEAEAGATIRQLVESRGEAHFRKLERTKLEELLALAGEVVIALGGGALVDPTMREQALRAGVVVGLSANAAELARRIGGDGSRPLLDDDRASTSLHQKIERLLIERAHAYRPVHLTRSTADRSVAEVAAELEATLRRGVFPISVGSTIAYSVRRADESAGAAVGALLSDLAPSRIAIVTDQDVAPLHLERFVAGLAAAGFAAHEIVVLEVGEPHKTLAAVERVTAALAHAECDRHSVVIGLGGGVVTDVAGFAASIFARGIPWVAVPTSLLGMVDAAIGGKTGVNLGQAKNAIGTFHHPAAVVVDITFSRTESARRVRSGLAEVVKSAAVRDVALFEWLEKNAVALSAREPAALAHAVEGAIAIKAEVVTEDPDERGARAVLNFGHTLGHAIEAASGYETFAHGEAVSVGMVAAARVGRHQGRSAPDVADRLEALLTALGLPTEVAESSGESALALIRYDKKRNRGTLPLVVPDVIGSAVRLPLSVELCVASFRRAMSRS